MTTRLRDPSIVHLIAYDQRGKTLLEQDLSLQKYCEESHPVLDDPAYRKAHAIVRLIGIVRKGGGQSTEEFEVQFDSSGACIGEAARLADGTVLGKWADMHASRSL
jgi:hypothetical protein